ARAIGEIGLDYHYDFSPRETQHAVFRAQVRLARELQRPVVIHTREADEDTITILREEGGGEVRGVLHCFTGDAALADAGLALGLFVSLAGIITFPKAEALRETVRRVPLERLLADTDSPFLAPVPYRAKRNEPAHGARLGGYDGDRSILYAAVVEFIHTATLVHDDIIDDSDLRRGRLAVHSRWGNDITVLLGDYLYIKSMALALTHDELEIIRLLCDVTLRMIEGELYQLTKNGDADITEDEHFDIMRRKTAYLFGGCAQIGGMLGKVSGEHERALQEYGFNLGMAFQLVDDLLDFTGDAQAVGKPIASDLREGKVTLPLIHLQHHENGGPAR